MDGKEHGLRTIWYENGTRAIETPYVNGKEHGTEISYHKHHEDGSKQAETVYVLGKKHGTRILYYEDGSKDSETPYVKGEMHGTGTWYWPDGSKKREAVFKNGNEISSKNSNPLRSRSTWLRLDGPCPRWLRLRT